MRPSKVIQQKCYRIVDLRQQRVKLISNTKENEQFTNLNVAKSQKSHDISQKQNAAKSPINRSQTQQIDYKPGTSKSLLNRNVSNITPSMMASQISNQNIYTEFDGKYYQPSIFQFRTNNLYLNDSGVQSSRRQFVFSEKYSKNLQNQKYMASRDKNRSQSKGSFSQNQKRSNQLQQYDQQSLHKLNTENNSKLKEFQINYGMHHENSLQNGQIVFDQQSSRLNQKESKCLKEDNSSKVNLTKSTYQNLNEDFQQQSTFTDSSYQSQIQITDFQQSKQLSSSCTARNIISQVNCKTSQGFYNNSTSKELSKSQKKNIQKLNSYSYQNQTTEKQQKQLSFNLNLSNLDNQKSTIYRYPSNALNTEQKNTQSCLAQDFLASTIKKKPAQLVFRNNEIQKNNNNLNIEKEEQQQQQQQYIYQLNISSDEFDQQFQNKSQIMRVSTSEENRKHRKTNSNTIPINKQQKCNIYSQKNLEDCQKQNSMIVFNLSSRPSTTNNLLIKNKIFRDEALNASLQRKQNKQNKKMFNSSVGIYLDLEDFNSQNTDQKNLTMSNYKSMIFKNTLQPFGQSKEISCSQLNLNEDCQLETIKQIEEAKNKQIDNFIGKIFKRSFYSDKNNLINKIATIFPKKKSLNCLNTTQKNQIFQESTSKHSKTQRLDINRKIIQNQIKKPVQQTEESSYDQLETQQSQIQNQQESYDYIQQQQENNNQIQEPYVVEDEKDKDIASQENSDDKYMLLNQYFHQKYTQPTYYQNKKQSILNQLSRTQCSYNDKIMQNSNRNQIQTDIEFYDKFEPWENDDKIINNVIDELQE